MYAIPCYLNIMDPPPPCNLKSKYYPGTYFLKLYLPPPAKLASEKAHIKANKMKTFS